VRNIFLIMVVTVILIGCGHLNPVSLDTNQSPSTQIAPDSDNHYLWGEWDFYFNESHDQVTSVPRRQGRFHLNATKFLEEYCADCLEITNLSNNGNGTVDLTVNIKHPFPGFPEYTGFDVKGIIMFDGSYDFPLDSTKYGLPSPYFKISWRESGDPEVLNPDGFTNRWTPDYDSGSELPIFNFWEGKYSSGLPDADLNAFLNFYSREERHIFETDSVVERTYTIWLPPDQPVKAAYAVDASWFPPDVTQVTDPISDFPFSANQPEVYHFKYVVNNNETVTDCDTMPIMGYVCDVLYMEVEEWEGERSSRYLLFLSDGSGGGGGLTDCDPVIDGRYASPQMGICTLGNGKFKGLALNYQFDAGWVKAVAYDLFEYTVNDPELDD